MRTLFLFFLISASALAESPLYAVLEKADCHSCHNRDGVAAGTHQELTISIRKTQATSKYDREPAGAQVAN